MRKLNSFEEHILMRLRNSGHRDVAKAAEEAWREGRAATLDASVSVDNRLRIDFETANKEATR